MVAIISHFKFMAGWNVGRGGVKGSCDYSLGGLVLRFVHSGDYRDMKSWSFACSTNEDRSSVSGPDQLQELEEQSKRGLYLFAGPALIGDDTDACPSQEKF